MEENAYSWENPEYRKTYHHTCSHVMAQAICRLYPGTKLAIGPAIEEGFYYDIDSEHTFSPDDFEAIEKEMRKICKEKLKLERFELPRAEAVALMEKAEQPYKVELINDLPEDAVISFYRQGEFTDLCAGPHLDSTGRIKGNGIKITNVTGAYWRGDSKRKMLQRFYAVSFPSKDMLDEYLARIEEAKKRDHRKLGKELGPLHAHGRRPRLPVLPAEGHGAASNTLIDYWRRGTQALRLCGDLHADDPQPRAVGALRPLGSLQAEHVHHRHRRRGLRHQADELPGRHAGLQVRAALLPRSAAARGRAGPWSTATSFPARCTACSVSAASRRTTRTSS